jgi:lysine/ornithine N-monooxygenase
MNNFSLCFMDKQSYQLINNINTKLLQLEWIKKELKYITYEFSKLLKLFFIQKFIFYIIAISLSVSGLRT